MIGVPTGAANPPLTVFLALRSFRFAADLAFGAFFGFVMALIFARRLPFFFQLQHHPKDRGKLIAVSLWNRPIFSTAIREESAPKVGSKQGKNDRSQDPIS